MRAHRSSVPRRTIAALLLAISTLQACTSLTPVAGPRPGQDIDGLVLHSGEEVVFPTSYGATLEDSTVVVRRLRDGSTVETYAVADIESVFSRDFDGVKTVAAGAGIVAGAVLLTYAFFSWGFRPGPDGEPY